MDSWTVGLLGRGDAGDFSNLWPPVFWLQGNQLVFAGGWGSTISWYPLSFSLFVFGGSFHLTH